MNSTSNVISFKNLKAVTKFKYSKSGKTAKLSWKKASNITGYEIYRSTSKNKGFKKIATLSRKKTAYKDSKLSKKKKYYYYIVCYRKSGNKIYRSVKTK